MGKMRALALAGGALAALASLAACAHQQSLVSLNPHFRLGFDDKGETVALTYGLPNSDDLSLMLECPKGSGRIELSDTAFGKSTSTIVLTSGGRSTRVPVQVSDTDDGGAAPRMVVGRLTSRAEALQAFRRTGVLDVSGGDRHYVITVQPERRAGLERFFKVCG